MLLGDEDKPLPSMFGMMMKYLSGIERHARSDQPFVVVVLARIPGRIEDDIVLRRAQFAEGLVGKLAVAQRRAALQPHIAEFEDFVIQPHVTSPARSVSELWLRSRFAALHPGYACFDGHAFNISRKMPFGNVDCAKRNVRRRARLPGRAMAKRARGAPAPEFLFTNATICLPETKREAERRKRHVARMSVSEIRGGHSSFQLVPGFHGACHRAGHFGPDPLVHPGYKFIRLQRREAERRQTRISNLRTPTFILPACGGRTEEGARRASIGTRSPVGVPPRRLLSEPTPPLSSGYALPGTRPDGRYPNRACPSPASSSQTGHGAGRAYSRSRPRTE